MLLTIAYQVRNTGTVQDMSVIFLSVGDVTFSAVSREVNEAKFDFPTPIECEVADDASRRAQASFTRRTKFLAQHIIRRVEAAVPKHRILFFFS